MLKKDFTDEDILMNNQYFKRYLTSFIITEIQTQTIIKNHFIFLNDKKIKGLTIANVGKNIEHQGPPCTAGENISH